MSSLVGMLASCGGAGEARGRHDAPASERGSVTTPSSTLAPESPPGSWTATAASPLAGRSDAVSAWTGDAMLVWGGRASGNGVTPQALSDGAAYDPATTAWHRWSPSPLAARWLASGVWTGHELLIWGGLDNRGMLADGAAYDPTTDTWRWLPASPLQARYGATAVWTGSEMIVWGGSTPAGGGNGAAYNPLTRRWRRLPAPPVPDSLSDAPVAWSGREMFLLVRPPTTNEMSSTPTVVAYEPGHDRWRVLPRMPVSSYDYRALLWTGDTLLVLTAAARSGDNAAWTPSDNRWHRIADVSPITADATQNALWTGSEAVLGDLLYDPAANRWRQLPSPPVALARDGVELWTGSELLIWGGSTQVFKTVTYSGAGAIYRPTPAIPVREQTFRSLPVQPPAPSAKPELFAVMGGHYDETQPLVDNRSGLPYYAVRDRSGRVFGDFGCDFIPAAVFNSPTFGLSRECAALTAGPGPKHAVVSGTIDGSVRCAANDEFEPPGGGDSIEHPELLPLQAQHDFGGGRRWAICGASPVADSRLFSLRSDNGGSTWTVTATGFGISPHHAGDVINITFASTTSARVRLRSIVGEFDDTYETTDGGNTWTRTSTQP